MPLVRQYKPEDKPELQKICVETTLFPLTERVRKWLPLAYNDYYTDCQSEFVSVLADDGGRAVGYILCAPDEERFRWEMRRTYLPKIKKISFLAYLLLKAELGKKDIFYPEYPAHLHIDILPFYQRMGMGTKLMDDLIAKLKKAGIAGVKLSCAAKNQKAVAFYKKFGFRELRRRSGTVVFGMKLTEE